MFLSLRWYWNAEKLKTPIMHFCLQKAHLALWLSSGIVSCIAGSGSGAILNAWQGTCMKLNVTKFWYWRLKWQHWQLWDILRNTRSSSSQTGAVCLQSADQPLKSRWEWVGNWNCQSLTVNLYKDNTKHVNIQIICLGKLVSILLSPLCSLNVMTQSWSELCKW